jgi:hypothetical protein
MKLILSAAVAAFLTVPQGEKVTLKHQPKAGDKLSMVESMSMKIDATVAAGGQEQKVAFEQKGSEKKAMEIREVEGGKATKIFYHIEEDVEEKKAPGQEGFEKSEKPLHGRKITVTSKDGKPAYEGAEGLDEKSLKSVDLEDDFSKTFPARPVAVGESWDVGSDVVRELFHDNKMDGKISFKLADVKEFQGRRSAFLDAKMEMKGNTDEGIEIAMALKGTIVVAIDRGYTLQVRMDGTVTMKAKNEQFEMNGAGPMKIALDTTVK